MQLKNIKSEEELDLAVINSLEGKPLLVKFYKDNCVPCKMLSLAIENLDADYEEKVNFVQAKLEDLGEEAFANYTIMSTPTLVRYEKGKVVGKHIGFIPEELLRNFVEG